MLSVQKKELAVHLSSAKKVLYDLKTQVEKQKVIVNGLRIKLDHVKRQTSVNDELGKFLGYSNELEELTGCSEEDKIEGPWNPLFDWFKDPIRFLGPSAIDAHDAGTQSYPPDESTQPTPEQAMAEEWSPGQYIPPVPPIPKPPEPSRPAKRHVLKAPNPTKVYTP